MGRLNVYMVSQSYGNDTPALNCKTMYKWPHDFDERTEGYAKNDSSECTQVLGSQFSACLVQ